MDLATEAYSVTKRFPGDEMFGLTSQIRRCSVLVAANIAEGCGRETRRSFVPLLRTAQGSLKELETHVLLSERVGLLANPNAADLLGACKKCGKMLRSLIRAVQRKQADEQVGTE
nr:four helix bundle protein [uncultured Gellertiella sp.]